MCKGPEVQTPMDPVWLEPRKQGEGDCEMRLVTEVWASNIIILISHVKNFSLYSKGTGKMIQL